MKTQPPSPSAENRWSWLIAAGVLLVLVLGVYAPALDADFVDYDDPMYVTENEWVREGLSGENFMKAWTVRVAGNWHPATMLSHLLDVTWFGLDPRGHHAVSIALHAVNALFLFGLLRSMFGGVIRPFLAAALFALHPFSVDSAVWIAERKNLLSTLFWLAGTWLYVRYTRRPSITAMLGVIGCYIAGLLSKPMLVTFPLTLLMLDVWPLHRVAGWSRAHWPRWRYLFQEKSLLFLLTVLFSAFTLVTQFPEGYEHTPDPQPLWAKAVFPIEHYRMYVEKFFWPVGLCVFYPRLELPPDYASVAGAFALLAGITIAAMVLARRAPAWLFGWLWFVGILFPVIGIIGIGQHSIADRYMYVPMIGLIIALFWGVPVPKGRPLRTVLLVMAAGMITACGLVARSLLPHWRTSEALFQRAVDVTQNNYVMLSNLGRQWMLQGRTEDAMGLFREALEINPRHVKSLNNLGFAYASQGRHGEAIPYYEQALALDARYATARANLARSLAEAGRYREALAQYERLIKANPGATELRKAYQETREKMGWSR